MPVSDRGRSEAATTQWRCVTDDGTVVHHEATPTWGHQGHVQCAEAERGGAASVRGAGPSEQGIWTPPRIAEMAVDALLRLSADESQSDRNRMRARLAAADLNKRLLALESGRNEAPR